MAINSQRYASPQTERGRFVDAVSSPHSNTGNKVSPVNKSHDLKVETGRSTAPFTNNFKRVNKSDNKVTAVIPVE